MISIVYVNYKTASLVIDSIKSVKENTTGVDYEIIVVDNASGDYSLDLIRKQYDNLGFGKANNLALDQAKGDCILFLNPDTLLLNNALFELYSFLRSSDKIGACGGNLYDEDNKPTTSFSRKYPSFFWELLSIMYISPISLSHPRSIFFNVSNKPIRVASIVGADLMVRKSVLSQVGAFAPEFFMNYEETELCHRIHKAKFDIYSVPLAKITHLEGRASYIKQSRLYFLYEGQYIYFRKVYGIFGCRLIFAITQLKSYIRILQFLLLGSPERRSYWKMKLETNRKVWNSEKIKRILK